MEAHQEIDGCEVLGFPELAQVVLDIREWVNIAPSESVERA